jgi:dienelactone hydrolase
MHTKLRYLTLLLITLPLTLQAAVKTETVEYKDGDTTLKGYLVYDEALQGKRPGVILVHEWWGLNDYAKERAEMLAELGFVAFAVDMYGDDKVTEHGKEAKEWMTQITSNVEAWQKRALLGLDIIKGHDLVDPDYTAAIGYCFGGATVMQMAYAGADLDGVVSFHGSLPPATEAQQQNIKARVLVAHGEADGFIPPERIEAFKQALDAADADWQMVTYGGAKHGFTNPGADAYGIDGVKYDEKADARSWALMQSFLEEIFSE